MVQDLVHNLCESLVENIDGVSGATSRKVVVATPVITLTGNSVTITCATTGATIYYTLDGSTPTSSSSQYSSAFTLDSSCTIKAIAINGGKSSGIAEEEYVKPITYLTQWRMMGNSVVHTDEYLTQWKVSGNSQVQQYLTQWKVEGNSVVSNPSANLPQGYKKCKYIENAGDSYIDLGYSNLLSYELKAQSVTAGVNNSIVLGNGTSAAQYFAYRKSLYWCLGGGDSETFSTLASSPTVIEITFANNSITGTINNQTLTRSGNKATDNFTLFRGSATSTGFYAYARVFYLKAFDNGVLVHNWLPCLDNNDVPCLYDTISQTTLYNQGTDTFSYELEQPVIYSCGDYSDVDGKYHVKISNGVTIYDIPLTEPLRKVNNVADTIEFADGVATVTRYFQEMLISASQIITMNQTINCYGIANFTGAKNDSLCMCIGYTMSNAAIFDIPDMSVRITYMFQSTTAFRAVWRNNSCENVNQFKELIDGCQFIYELATPTTETIQASPFPISATDTYTSVNDTPYSAFTYANPLIYSCGDYSDVDGKYHVKISNGVDVFDIALTEPLRKVGDVADKIEFADGGAILTRNIGNKKFSELSISYATSSSGRSRFQAAIANKLSGSNNGLLCSKYTTATWYDVANNSSGRDKIIGTTQQAIAVHDDAYTDADTFKADNANVEVFYLLATPTTEVIQVSPFPISPTDTYTSANDTPYSAFEYKKNVEIWSCGEYSAVDGKYHILVQPQGGSIADIALDEPLRKVNDVADTIEFADGVATLTRCLTSIDMGSYGNYSRTNVRDYNDRYGIVGMGLNGNNYPQAKYPSSGSVAANILTAIWNTETRDSVYIPRGNKIISMAANGTIVLYDEDFNDYNSYSAFQTLMQEIHPELIYELAIPTTETIQVPQIEEAESYSCVISQGGKAVSWSSFETE